MPTLVVTKTQRRGKRRCFNGAFPFCVRIQKTRYSCRARCPDEAIGRLYLRYPDIWNHIPENVQYEFLYEEGAIMAYIPNLTIYGFGVDEASALGAMIRTNAALFGTTVTEKLD